jgi:hypothetical protein
VEVKDYRLYARDDSPCGKTWEKWVELWWSWCYSDPSGKSPVEDTNGAFCFKNQPVESVWFLGGTFGGKVERTCQIPPGRSIFFPVVNDIISFLTDPELKSEDELHCYAKSDIDNTLILQVTLDSLEIKGLRAYRVHSSLFNITLTSNDSSRVASTLAVSDGYWLFLRPLTQGDHVLEFIGEKLEYDKMDNSKSNPLEYLPKFRVEVKYNLHSM